jgi:amino acid transporter
MGQVLNIIKKTALYLARKKYCKTAIEDRADLAAIREKPTPSMIVGLILIAFSYVIGLPTVVALGVLAVSMGKPMVGIIGGAVIYTISTIIFILGIKMAGKKYVQVFFRWVVRVVLEKILGKDVRALSEPGSDNKS